MATKKNITVNGVLTPVWQTDATAQQIDDAVVAAQNAVLYTAQSKTAAEQAQARSNINAAPGGYGYGEQITCYNFTQERSAILDQFDEILAGMGNDTTKQILLYDASVSLAQRACSARITKSDANNSSVSSDFDENGRAIVYRKKGGIWQPVEFVNPNLMLGVEYRTTERYLGKPVYVKTVDTGALPNATYKEISASFPNADRFLSIYGSAYQDSSHLIPLPCLRYGTDSYNTTHAVQVTVNNTTSITISTAIDMSSFAESSVCVKYTKSTD